MDFFTNSDVQKYTIIFLCIVVCFVFMNLFVDRKIHKVKVDAKAKEEDFNFKMNMLKSIIGENQLQIIKEFKESKERQERILEKDMKRILKIISNRIKDDYETYSRDRQSEISFEEVEEIATTIEQISPKFFSDEVQGENHIEHVCPRHT